MHVHLVLVVIAGSAFIDFGTDGLALCMKGVVWHRHLEEV